MSFPGNVCSPVRLSSEMPHETLRSCSILKMQFQRSRNDPRMCVSANFHGSLWNDSYRGLCSERPFRILQAFPALTGGKVGFSTPFKGFGGSAFPPMPAEEARFPLHSMRYRKIVYSEAPCSGRDREGVVRAAVVVRVVVRAIVARYGALEAVRDRVVLPAVVRGERTVTLPPGKSKGLS